VESNSWNDIILKSVVVSILNQFQKEMGRFLIKLVGKSILFISYVPVMIPVFLHIECPM